MTGVRKMRLRDVLEEAGGGIQTGPFGSQLHAADYVAEGTPSVMPQNIGDNRIDSAGIARVSAQDMERLDRYSLKAGDIVYSRRGDVERRALVRAENAGWLCGTGCLRVRVGDQAIHDSTFLSYALGDPDTRAWIVNHAVGATMPNLNTQILGGAPVSVPHIAEQRAIAEVLGALDDKIAANDALVGAGQRLADALVVEAQQESHVPLEALAFVEMGSSPPGANLNHDGRGVVFYQGVRDFGVKYPKRRVWTDAPVKTAGAGDTLFSVRAPVGSLNMAAEECCIGRGVASVRSRDARPATLFHTLRVSGAVWAEYASEGTIYGSINRKQLISLRILPIAEGREVEVEGKVSLIASRVSAALSESTQLAALRDALLPALMSGRIRVKDAEKTVSEVV